MPPKPTIPSSYSVPKVWSPPTAEGQPFGGINRPTAFPRSERALPKGEHPLQLYSLGTPNGQKVSILLEELNALKGVKYDAWTIKIMESDQFTSGFTALNPNQKIPAMYDYGVDGEPIRLFESGSILLYLAEKYEAFISKDIRTKTETMNWLFWQVGTAPFIGGGFGHFFYYAPTSFEYCIDRYSMETKRILHVLELQLEGKEYVLGSEYSIADIAIFPWIYTGLVTYYKAKEFLNLDEYINVSRWMKTLLARPAVQKGLKVTPF
jgi:GST-like protein